MKEDFVHLHTHSDFSQLDGAATVAAYAAEAAARGHVAMALTDHGTMRGSYDFLESCGEHGVKPIYGVEFYVARDMHRKGVTDDERTEVAAGLKGTAATAKVKEFEEVEGIRDRWHTTAWALDDVGLRNLYRLSSKAWIEGFYYKPRVDLDAICAHDEGLLVSTGCLSSPANDMWMSGKKREALAFVDRLYETFGDRLLLEVQPHDIDAQREVNALWSVMRKKRYPRARLVATQDAHYLRREDSKHHEVLLCIGTGSKMADPRRFKFDGDEFHFRTREEMEDAFRRHTGLSEEDVKLALDTTVEVGERCEAAIVVDRKKAILPNVAIPPEHKDELAYVRALCMKGVAWRDVPGRAKRIAEAEGIDPADALKRYSDRLKRELGVIHKQRFLGYFLVIHEIYEWARGQRIMPGPGRGSAGGSLVCFLLGITSIDPIEHNLVFERFLTDQRTDLPDIDCDWNDRRRGEVVNHIRELYGQDKVCYISTHGKLTGKQVLKDAARVFDVPYFEANSVTEHVIERDAGDERVYRCLEDSFEQVDALRNFAERWPDVAEHAAALEGFTKTIGVHAAGIIASPVPLVDLMPMETRASSKGGERHIVSAYDMRGAQAMGLVKMDMLGLRTLSQLQLCVEEVERNRGETIDLESLALDDAETLRGFTEGDFIGVFQYDSPSSRRLCMGIEFTHFEDIATMTAINRPGATRSGLADIYIDRKHRGVSIDDLTDDETWHPKVREITKDTLGILAYQEHVMRVFVEVAGFSAVDADKMRKIIGKREGAEAMERERDRFIEGANLATPDLVDGIAHSLYTAIAQSGAYSFNKSHATAYGVIAYWCMWCKRRFPLEWSWAVASTEPDLNMVRRAARDGARRGVKFLPPDVSVSGEGFATDAERNAVLGSLGNLKGVGPKAIEKIVEAQPFSSLGDLLTRGKPNKTVFVALARAGALDGLAPNRRWAVESGLDEGCWKAWRRKSGALVADMDAARGAAEADWSEEEKLVEASKIDPLAASEGALQPWRRALEAVRVTVEDTGDADFWSPDNEGMLAWVAGVVTDSEESVVGDRYDGPPLTDAAKARRGWGHPVLKGAMEGMSGAEARFRVDWRSFAELSWLAKVGTPVLALAVISPRWTNLDVVAAVLLEEIRQGVAEGMVPDIVLGRHPARDYEWPTPGAAQAGLRAVTAGRGKATATGIVLARQERITKKKSRMGHFFVAGTDGACRVVVMPDAWEEARKVVAQGDLVTVMGEWSDDRSLLVGTRGGRIIQRKRNRQITDPAA